MRHPLNSLRRLFRKPPPKPEPPEKQYRRLLKTVRGLRVEERHEVVKIVLDSLTDRDAMDLLQDLGRTTRLAYSKTEVLLHTETRSAYLRSRAALKEPWTVAWLESCLQPGEVLYDIGANTGVYSLVAAKLHGPALRVFAFEPAFANFSDLNRNIVLNVVEKQITALPVALSDRERLISFGFRNLQAGAALHGVEEAVGKGGEEATHVLSVLGRPLDTIVNSLGLPAPHHVKIDVDGGELEVLAGGGETLKSPHLRTVMIEITSDAEMAESVDRFFVERGLIKAREFHKTPARGQQEGCWYALYARDPASLPTAAFEDLTTDRTRGADNDLDHAKVTR